jgi:hypothetical protein
LNDNVLVIYVDSRAESRKRLRLRLRLRKKKKRGWMIEGSAKLNTIRRRQRHWVWDHPELGTWRTSILTGPHHLVYLPKFYNEGIAQANLVKILKCKI